MTFLGPLVVRLTGLSRRNGNILWGPRLSASVPNGVRTDLAAAIDRPDLQTLAGTHLCPFHAFPKTIKHQRDLTRRGRPRRRAPKVPAALSPKRFRFFTNFDPV
jgi:hypothetical protein